MNSALRLFLLLGLAGLPWATTSFAPPGRSSAVLPLTPRWTTGAVGTLGDKTLIGPVTIDLALTGEYDPTRWGWAVVLDYESLTVATGSLVRFLPHPSGAPVVIRAVGPIVINGTILLDGEAGHSYSAFPAHSNPGPGGFRGGTGKSDPVLADESAGHGPGGGHLHPSADYYAGGSASHATLGPDADPNRGPSGTTYSSPRSSPLIGGSGGSGGVGYGASPGGGGGAGGGAILIGSDTFIHLAGTISAKGGDAGSGNEPGGAGSGGMIRLASPIITAGNHYLVATGGTTGFGTGGGVGWIRIEQAGDPLAINSTPGASQAPLEEFLPAAPPSVTFMWWREESGTQWVSITQEPLDNIFSAGTADIYYPVAGVRVFRVEGRNVPLGVPLHVRMTDTRGAAIVDSTHTMGEVNTQRTTSTVATSWTDVPIDFSLGVHTIQVRAQLP